MCDQDRRGPRDTLSNSDVVSVPDDLVLSDSDPEEDPARLPLTTEVRELTSSSEEEDEEVRGPPPAPGGPRGAFSLRGGNSSFSHRSRSIFDCLDGVAKATPAAESQEAQGDRALFAKPLPPPPLASRRQNGGEGKRGVPDYLLHPERWTRYSLEDTPDTSERQNLTVAQQYLQGLQRRREETHTPPPPCGTPQQRMVFSRPGQAGRGPGLDDTKPPGGRELKKYLSHLQEEEEEEQEEEQEQGDLGVTLGSPGGRQRKRNMEQRGGPRVEQQQGEEEEEEQEEEQKEDLKHGPPTFVSFKKAKRKNYRKTSKPEDD